MNRRLANLVVAAVILLPAAAKAVFAGPVGIDNPRPVTIGAPYPGEPSLQAVLDGIFGVGVINASTNQQSAGQWMTATLPPTVITLELRAEFAGGAAGNIFGVWTDPDEEDGTLPVLRPIFTGPASPFTLASILWTTSSSGSILAPTGDPNVAAGPFAGINNARFGFYLERASGARFFTMDTLNTSDAPRAVAYRNPTGSAWAVGFEDSLKGGVGDYQDMVVKIESIDVVPEPGAVTLLALGALPLMAKRRPRRREPGALAA